VFIVVKGLLDRIEDTALSRIVANTSYVLPVAPVARSVVVDEEAFIPLRAYPPIDIQV
jgi:hypothetical protein